MDVQKTISCINKGGRGSSDIQTSASPVNTGDWIKKGKTMNHFVYPPKLPDDDECEVFKADLKPVIEAKLAECLDRMEGLKTERQRLIGEILKAKPRSKERWFLKEWEAAVFSEYYVIQKWVSYWLNLSSKATNEPIADPKFSKFEEFELERARQFPFEQLVTTEFRRAGNKWFAKCPFHEEKTASFCIFPDNRAKCFGGCSWSGDTIQFLMDSKGVTFAEAVRQLL